MQQSLRGPGETAEIKGETPVLSTVIRLVVLRKSAQQHDNDIIAEIRDGQIRLAVATAKKNRDRHRIFVGYGQIDSSLTVEIGRPAPPAGRSLP